MAKPPNQSGTQEGFIPVKGGKKASKKPASKKPAAKPAAGGYDWGDGRNVHSIPLAQHQQNATGVANYGVTPNTPLDQPLTTGQAYSMANATAGRTFNPQIDANRQLQVNTPAWYQNYIDTTGKQQVAAQAYAKPILDTAQAAVGNAAATAPGLDPSSPQYAVEQQAAKGRQTMAQDSANYLAGVAAATDAYFGGQANVASRELPQVRAGLLSQYGQLQSQKADAATAAYGDIRSNEQNAAIARQTLGLNTAKATADVANDQAVLDQKTQAAKDKASATGSTPNKYGIPKKQWDAWSSSHRQRVIDAFDKKNGTDKTAEKKAADAAKNKVAIKKATGGVQTSVTNIISKWNGLLGQETDDTSKPKDPVTGQYPGRPITPSDIKKILGAKNDAGLIHVALLVKVGKPLDQAAIDYLHQKDPNIRIPREWLRGKRASGNLPGTTGVDPSTGRPG